MYYRKDWLMQQIEFAVQAIVRAVLKKEDSMYEIMDVEKHTPSDMLYNKLTGLLGEMKINEAENLLFESIESDDKNFLTVALDFYSRLNEFDDDTLEAHDFSREEILSGIKEIGEYYGAKFEIIEI